MVSTGVKATSKVVCAAFLKHVVKMHWPSERGRGRMSEHTKTPSAQGGKRRPRRSWTSFKLSFVLYVNTFQA